MKRIPKARHTEEFKAAAQLIDAGRRPAEMACEIGVVEQTLHNWLKAQREDQTFLADTLSPARQTRPVNGRLDLQMGLSSEELPVRVSTHMLTAISSEQL